MSDFSNNSNRDGDIFDDVESCFDSDRGGIPNMTPNILNDGHHLQHKALEESVLRPKCKI